MKKDIFEIISEICSSDKINDVEWVKDKLKEKEADNPGKFWDAEDGGEG